LEVSKAGFSKYVQTGIVLQVATNPTIDVPLKVGSVTEQVQVEANASMVETQNTGIGQVIDSQRVVELPLVGRQVTDLILLAGGATQGVDGLNTSRNYPTAVISVAGGLSSGLTYVLDGAMHNDPYNSLGLPLPFVDALQEFKVETSALPAQYGMHSAAAVNAVTKSGTNELHGTVFEFLRNYHFNARDFFAASRDSLKRNQFGGVIGGPIKKNKLFFFGGFQYTTTRQNAVINPSFVPTQQMLSGDFTAIASPACNGGRQIALKAPFVNNQISPALFSTPALNITKQLPAATNACGLSTYGNVNDANDRQAAGKVDYQLTPTHSMFARYVAANYVAPVPYDFNHNVLTTLLGSGFDELIQSFVLGDTYLIGASTVNSFRATLNRPAIARIGAQFFDGPDVGINMFSYLPKSMVMSVTGGPSIGAQTSGSAEFRHVTVQFGDDLSLVRGTHQMAFGANGAHWVSNSYARAVSQGNFVFNGQATGLGLADFLTGQVFNFTQAAPNLTFEREYYFGFYAQDSWKVKPRLTVNYGVRWEPWLPMSNSQGIVYHFDQNAFNQGIHSTQFTNAPNGLFFPGDAGFPGKSGMYKQWKDLAPRLGMVWDPKGDGRTSVRASFGMFYDLVPVSYNINTVTAPPWGDKVLFVSPPGGLANPYLNQPGGNPFPLYISKDVPFIFFWTYNNWNYNTHTAYVEAWNLSIQRQLGKNWLVSANYIGNHSVHLPTSVELDPAVFGPGATTANTNQRRRLYLQNPAQGQYLGSIDHWDDGGTASYHGLLFSVQRRLSHGVTVTGNYTWSHCISDYFNDVPSGVASSGVYLFQNNRSLDRGDCATSASDRRHILNMTGVFETPRFAGRLMRILATGWRASAIVNAQSGAALTPLTGIDNSLTGEGLQRPNLTGSPIKGNGSVTNFLNLGAFSQPATGTFGAVGVGTVRGPGMLQVNTGLTRIFRIRERQTIEFRAEANNVLNRLNPANPVLNMNANNFGQITNDINYTVGQTGDPRLLQFALKFVF
jgi:hypothetical protein